MDKNYVQDGVLDLDSLISDINNNNVDINNDIKLNNTELLISLDDNTKCDDTNNDIVSI